MLTTIVGARRSKHVFGVVLAIDFGAVTVSTLDSDMHLELESQTTSSADKDVTQLRRVNYVRDADTFWALDAVEIQHVFLQLRLAPART